MKTASLKNNKVRNCQVKKCRKRMIKTKRIVKAR